MKKHLPFSTSDKSTWNSFSGKGIHSVLLMLFISLFNAASFGQDVHLSQYHLTPLLINPAQAGAYTNFELIANYKTQWTSIYPNTFKTIMFTYDGYVIPKKWRKKRLAAGLNIFNDRGGMGNMSTTQANASIGYHARLSSQSMLGAALLGGFYQRNIKYGSFAWDEQYQNGAYNPAHPTGEASSQNDQSIISPDVGAGILYQYTKREKYTGANDLLVIHAGLALFHVNRPQYSFYGFPEKLYEKKVCHADVLFGLKNTGFAVMPGFIYMSQGPSSEIYSGCFLRYKLQEQLKFTGLVKSTSFVVGTHVRAGDAIIPSFQLEMGDYTIGISYDVNISGLRTATSGKGGFEIGLRYGNLSQFMYKSAASF